MMATHRHKSLNAYNFNHVHCHNHQNHIHPTHTHSRANQTCNESCIDTTFDDARHHRHDHSFVKWFYVMGFCDLFAVSLVVPILPIYALTLGMTNTQIGIVISVFSALQCISSPFVGRWSDVYGRKTTLVWSLFFASISYLVLAISTWKNSFVLFVIGRVIAGIVKHSQTLVRAYFADVMSKEDGAIVFSHFLAISNIGYIIGPLIGGRMAETQAGFFSICFLAAFLFLLNTVIIEYCIPNVLNVHHYRYSNEDKDDFFTFLTNLGYSRLWDAFLLRFLVSFSISLYRENFVLILSEKYSVSSKASGYILSYQAMVAVVASFLVAPMLVYVGIYSLLFYCSIALCFTLYCLTACRELWTCLVFLIPLGFCNSTLCNVITELIVSRCRADLCGTVVGIGHSIMSLSRMLAPVISGYLLDRDVNGPGVAATSFSVLTVLMTLWILYHNNGLGQDSDGSSEDEDIVRCPIHDMDCIRPC